MFGSPQKRDGLLITFEGGDGAGKSTQVRFLHALLKRAGVDVVCLREPGGTRIGEALRAIVLDPENTQLSDRTELLIYEAARAQLVEQVIMPALDRGAVVICDRFFDSTVAYQAYGRGLDRLFVEEANLFATQDLAPDITVVLQCAESVGLARAAERGPVDRLEMAGDDFHARVEAAFADLAESGVSRVRAVTSQPTKAATLRLVLQALSGKASWADEFLSWNNDQLSNALQGVEGADNLFRDKSAPACQSADSTDEVICG